MLSPNLSVLFYSAYIMRMAESFKDLLSVYTHNHISLYQISLKGII